MTATPVHECIISPPETGGRADLASSADELAAAVGVGDGDHVEVWLETTGEVGDAERAAIEHAATGAVSGAYTVVHAFDARLFKSVAGAVSELHELAAPVEVTVGLPAGVPPRCDRSVSWTWGRR